MMRRLLALLLLIVATQTFAANAIYLPGLGALDAGWARHFLRDGMNHFNNGEYIYALEYLDNAIQHAPTPAVAAFAHMYKGRAFYGLKNYGKAKAEFETAFSAAPEAGLYYAIAGSTAFGAGQFTDAQAFFERGLKAAPHHDLLLNNLAWFRATCPDAAFRNGAEAVRLAREACQLSHWQDSVFMDTLAAAQSEARDFAGAAATEQRALSDKDAERLERGAAEQRLRLYQHAQPYRAKEGR